MYKGQINHNVYPSICPSSIQKSKITKNGKKIGKNRGDVRQMRRGEVAGMGKGHKRKGKGVAGRGKGKRKGVCRDRRGEEEGEKGKKRRKEVGRQKGKGKNARGRKKENVCSVNHPILSSRPSPVLLQTSPIVQSPVQNAKAPKAT